MLSFAFAGSSDFVLPILSSIFHHQGQNLSDIAQTQAKNIPLHLLPEEFAQIWVQIPSNFWTLPLLNQKYELSVVITQAASNNRGKIVRNPVESWALEHKVKTFTPEKISKDIETLKTYRLDLGIVASYGQILSSSVLKIPNFGWVNWHPSKLPSYRGPTPMQSLVASGENQTALTWIEMASKMDAGDMLLQIDQNFDEVSDILNLASQMGNLGASTWAMVACLHLYQQTFPQFQFSIPQDPQKVSTCHILEKNDRLVTLKNQTAWQIYNHFRAYKNFPGTTFISEYFEQEVKILELDTDLLNQQSEQYQLSLKELLNNSGILEEKKVFGEFLKLKNQIFLICKDQTLLPLKTAQLLENNSRVALGGFNFR